MKRMQCVYLVLSMCILILTSGCAVSVPWNMENQPAENQQISIIITSDPEEIEIYHNDILLGTTPLNINRLWVSNFDRITTKKAGYRTGIYEFYQGSHSDHWPTRQYVKLEKEQSGAKSRIKMHFKLRHGTDLGQKNIQIYGSAALILLLILL